MPCRESGWASFNVTSSRPVQLSSKTSSDYSGYMEIYEDTYEKISYKIKQAEEVAEAAKTQIPDGTNDDDALDMFADAIDSKGEIIFLYMLYCTILKTQKKFSC